jgi:hypothetical protein
VLQHRGAGGIAVAGRDRVEDALVLLSRVSDRFPEYGDRREQLAESQLKVRAAFDVDASGLALYD